MYGKALPVGVDWGSFSVEKSTEFVDNPVEKTQQKGILFRGILIRKQKAEILIYKRISAFLFL